MCPPSLLPAVTARSRLTRLPGARAPRAVLSRVSRMTSAVKVAWSCCATVRQHPLTEMESPGETSEVTSGPRTVSRMASPWSSMCSTTPSPSMIPVNISGVPSLCPTRGERQADVGLRTRSDRGGLEQVEAYGVRDGPHPEVADAGEPGAEKHRCDVHDDLVDQPGAQERRGQGRAALQEDVLPVPRVELGERLVRVPGLKQDRLGGVIEDASPDRQPTPPHDCPQQLGLARQALVGLVADRELRRGGERRPGADEDRRA